MEDYRARVGAWAARFSWRSAVGRVGTKGGNRMGPIILCAAVLETLLVIGGVELNPGPVYNIVQVLCSGCDRNLKSETHCESVAGGIITAVEMLSFKLRRVENGTVTDVDLRDSGFLKRN